MERVVWGYVRAKGPHFLPDRVPGANLREPFALTSAAAQATIEACQGLHPSARICRAITNDTGLSAAKAHPDEDEFLDVVRMPLGEAIDRVMRGELCDGKSAVGLLMAGRLLS